MKKSELKELIKTSLLEEEYLEDDPKAVQALEDAENAEAAEEKDYNPDQEQLDDEDEIFMPYDDEGRPLGEDLKRVDSIAEADAIVEAWNSKESLTENKQAGIQELKRILNDAAALGDEARQIFEMYFPNELRTAEAYDVFSFGSSSNSYDTTLASLIADMEEEID